MYGRFGARAAALAAVVAILASSLIAFGNSEASPAVRSLLELRQEHVVLQRWDLSCGAAALATILTYQHGETVSERDVALAMMSRDEYLANPSIVTIRQGFSLLDMKRYVDGKGYDGIALGRLTLDTLSDYAPIIVPIAVHGYRHFVVFLGVRDDRVHLADPAFGNRTMSRRRFERSWLELPDLGRVGFYVQRTDGLLPPDRLSLRTGIAAAAR